MRRLIGILILIFDAAAIGAGLGHAYGASGFQVGERGVDVVLRLFDRIRMPVRIVVNRAVMGELPPGIDDGHGGCVTGSRPSADFPLGVEHDTGRGRLALRVQGFVLFAGHMAFEARCGRNYLQPDNAVSGRIALDGLHVAPAEMFADIRAVMVSPFQNDRFAFEIGQ